MSYRNMAYKQYDLFLRSKSTAAIVMLEIEKILSCMRKEFVLLGGAARDILLHGAEAVPRDLDIVVGETTVEELGRALPLGRNRFGGLKGHWNGCEIDLWPLQDSWGLKGKSHPTFSDLVLATTFNLEAIAFAPGVEIRLYEAGCIACLEQRLLELTGSPVRFPALNLVRASLFCKRFGLQTGPKLRAFIQTKRNQDAFEMFWNIKEERYPLEDLSPDELRQFLEL